VIQTVWIQTSAPINGDLGRTEPGWYFVEGGEVHMCKESGEPTGQTQRVAAGDDARVIAGRLRKRAWLKLEQASDFNRPLGYARLGNA
jgi:hypothetical protein